MTPRTLGKKYDKIAAWWQEQHKNGVYGVAQLEKALSFRASGGTALDVGCGTGGRLVSALQKMNYAVTGIDVSAEMIKLACENHPNERFIHEDICAWNTTEKYDFICAWDSIFHLPHHKQEMVINKLCRFLNRDGILIYTFGNALGDHIDEWRGESFYYSSIGVNENLRLLIENQLTVLHLELDQYPEKHVYVIAKKQ